MIAFGSTNRSSSLGWTGLVAQQCRAVDTGREHVPGHPDLGQVQAEGGVSQHTSPRGQDSRPDVVTAVVGPGDVVRLEIAIHQAPGDCLGLADGADPTSA